MHALPVAVGHDAGAGPFNTPYRQPNVRHPFLPDSAARGQGFGMGGMGMGMATGSPWRQDYAHQYRQRQPDTFL